jgi:hypothetical protein
MRLVVRSLRAWRAAVPLVRCHRLALTRGPMRRLRAVFGTTSILIAACTSAPTVTQSNPSTAACFDAAKVRGVYDEWAHKAVANLSDDMDMDRVVASLRPDGPTVCSGNVVRVADADRRSSHLRS